MTKPVALFILIISLSASCKNKGNKLIPLLKPATSLYIDNCSYGVGLGTPKYFLSITFYVVNNTNAVQKYAGAFLDASTLYLTDNKNLIAPRWIPTDDETFEPLIIAPHRAVKAHASFEFVKIPDTTFTFKFGMRLISTIEKDYFKNIADTAIKNARVIWSEKILFKTDRNHNTPEPSDIEYKQRILNRPLVDYHVLTSEDRKNYVLTISQKSLSVVRDTILTNFAKKRKYQQSIVDVPVKLINRSNDTLRYVNLTCSTDDIFMFNNVRLSFLQPLCLSNYPTDYKIAPHSSQKFKFLAKVNRRLGTTDKFKIGMSLQIIDHGKWEFDVFEMLMRPETSNLIWSNEVQIP